MISAASRSCHLAESTSTGDDATDEGAADTEDDGEPLFDGQSAVNEASLWVRFNVTGSSCCQ